MDARPPAAPPELLGRLAAVRAAADGRALACEAAATVLTLVEADGARVSLPSVESPGFDTAYVRGGRGSGRAEDATVGVLPPGATSWTSADGTAAEPDRREMPGGPAATVPVPTGGTSRRLPHAVPVPEAPPPAGAIEAFRESGRPEFTEAEAATLAGFAALLGSCFDDLAVRRELQRRSEQLDAVLQASIALNSVRELDPLLGLLTETAVQLTGAEAGALLLHEERKTSLFFRAAHGGHGDAIREMRLEPGEGLAGWVALHGEPVLVDDAGADPRHTSRISALTGVAPKALVCVPLRVKDDVLGAMEVFRTKPGTVFTPADLTLLQALAAQAAVTVRNALLYRLSITDELTGLYSFRFFQDAFRRELKLAEKSGAPLSLAIIDVDAFKALNDAHGHRAGDAALQRVAEIVRAGLRDTDIVARYGGDEIVITFREMPKEAAVAVSERICRRVAEATIEEDGRRVRTTCSIGVASFPEDTGSTDRLFYLADAALYTAKRAGRNRVRAYSSGNVSGALPLS